MKKQKKFCKLCYLILLNLFFSHAFAQCTLDAKLSSITGNCSGSSSLILNSFATPSQIVWKKDNLILSTVLPTPDSIGNTVAGGNGAGSAVNQLNQPRGIFVDDEGSLYVSEASNGRVAKWLPGATSGITVAGGNGSGINANQLSFPTSVFVDNNKNVYVSELGNHRVSKWAQGATSGITVAGGNGAGSAENQIDNPYGIYVVGNFIFVSDFTNNRVQKWLEGASSGSTIAGGNGAGSAPNQLNTPRGVFVDANNNLYVADDFNSRIQKWAPNALSGVTVAGGNGQGAAANQLNGPYFIYIDGSGNLFISDWNNHRVQKWAPGATSGVTVAGGNGQGAAANQLDLPTGLFLDKDGNVYVAERGNSRVQKWLQTINNNYTPQESGNYKADVTNYIGCTGTTNMVTINQGTIYTFNGTGNIDIASNWANNMIPPSVLPSCSQVLIKPKAGGECIINTALTFKPGAIFTLTPGSVINVSNNIIIEAGSQLSISTSPVSNVTANSAISGGIITSDASGIVTERGICYNTSPNPTVSNNKVSGGSGSGSYNVYLTTLTAGITYYIRAYATSSTGTVYGNEVLFINGVLPTVSTSVASSITSTFAVSGGNVSNTGSATVIERGICFNTTGNPTTSNAVILSGNGTGSYTSNVSNLKANTNYFAKAFARSYAGTAYGNQISFKTAPGLPQLSTSEAVILSVSTASVGGTITNDGAASITAKGICYSALINPEITDSIVTAGAGSGGFVSSLTGLTSFTPYYARAFATNSFGTAYGNMIKFSTGCPYTGSMGGSYVVIQDGWSDWSPGDIVQVTDGPGANQVNLSKVWPNPAYGSIVSPLLVNVNPLNGIASVPLVTFGNYGSLATTQGVGVDDEAGYVSSCSGQISLTMRVTYNGSSQGDFKLVLQKK